MQVYSVLDHLIRPETQKGDSHMRPQRSTAFPPENITPKEMFHRSQVHARQQKLSASNAELPQL